MDVPGLHKSLLNPHYLPLAFLLAPLKKKFLGEKKNKRERILPIRTFLHVKRFSNLVFCFKINQSISVTLLIIHKVN